LIRAGERTVLSGVTTNEAHAEKKTVMTIPIKIIENNLL